MKLRSISGSLVILIFILTACSNYTRASLSSYVYLPHARNIEYLSLENLSSANQVALTTTPESTPSSTEQLESSTSAESKVTITGTVVNASGASVPADTVVVLYIFNTEKNELQNSDVTTIDSDASFRFDNVSAEPGITFLISSSYQNIVYYSTPVAFDPSVVEYSIPLTIYGATVDQTDLSLNQVQIQLDFSVDGKMTVRSLYVVVNSGTESVSIMADETSISFIHIPDEAQDIQFKLAAGSATPAQTNNGFALLPGSDKQYGIIAIYDLPFSNKLEIDQSFLLPVDELSILTPENIRIKSRQLSDAGTSTSDGISTHQYQASSLVAGSVVSMTISGNPGQPNGFHIENQTLTMIIIGTAGLILIGLGIFLFFREKTKTARHSDLDDDSNGNNDSFGKNPDDIMDAIIALEERYKKGDIPSDVFRKKRSELKNRLNKN